MSAPLFACTRCNSRHPFEELSQGQQLCKDCRGAFPIVKCTYCRTEFQECSKGGTASVCRKCEANVKLYGKPTACEYCNIIAAFIGAKCQRCTNSEKRYGPPITCEQCKQRCAFDRKDDSRKKVDGKLLCWLCTLSYKRALAKAKQNNTTRHASISLSKSSHHRSASQNHKRSLSHTNKPKKTEHSPAKKPRTEINKSTNGSVPTRFSNDSHGVSDHLPQEQSPQEKKHQGFGLSPLQPWKQQTKKLNAFRDSGLLDSNTSDHVVALTQLKDQIASLQKQLTQKDQQMLTREKQTAEQKAQHGVLERELRLKIQAMQKSHGDMVEDLQARVRVLTKQVVTLSKANKKGNSTDSPRL